VKIDLVEGPGDGRPRYRADIGRNDRWLVCDDKGVILEISRQEKPGAAREWAERVRAALELLKGIPTTILDKSASQGLHVTFIYPNGIEAPIEAGESEVPA
jgi:hypothetical protein